MADQPTGANTGADAQGGAGATDRIREVARETAQQAREQATRVVDQIRDQAESLANEKKAAAADQISGLASALRKSADELQGQEFGFADYVVRAADGLEELSETIRERDFGTILSDVEALAKRYPAFFLGGTVMAGFLFARFLKSSAEQGSGREAPDGQTGSRQRSGRGGGQARRRPGQQGSRAGGGQAGGLHGTAT